MATGFMSAMRSVGQLATSRSPVNFGWTPKAVPEGRCSRLMRIQRNIRILRAQALLGMLIAPLCVGAANITVVGLFPGKALVVVNNAPPRTLSVGQASPEGVKLIATDTRSATLEFDGKKHVLEIGEHFATSAPGAVPTTTLAADTRGHFVTMGSINGGSMRFLVDTGATLVAIPARDATRLGIDYRKGSPGSVQTAAGPAPAWRVRFDTVQLGDVTINQVDGIVMEAGLDIALLGMSFLNRTEMKREGQTMTLTKRF
jgi:aspartyl protease family protein